MKFRDLLKHVRTVSLEAFAHQDVPFELLVESLQPERNLDRNPLFQVMFAFQNTPQPTYELTGLSASSLPIDDHSSKFDLTMFIYQRAEGLLATIEYRTDLFSSKTIARMLGHFQTLLEGICVNPDQSLTELPLLTTHERQQFMRGWRDTKRDHPQATCFHHLFERQVTHTPETIAVVFEDQMLTYRALNARANQLAHYLQTLGVEPETCVGICLERSLEMILALLGVIKAGGAYVPMEPAYPLDRSALMLADANVPVVLTQQKLVERLPASTIGCDRSLPRCLCC